MAAVRRKGPDLYAGRSPLVIPAYAIPEAAHYLRLPAGTVRSWLFGYDYRTQQGKKRFKPVIKIADREAKLLSFRNLVELYVLSAIRRGYGVKLAAVRRAITYLKPASAHPLAEIRLLTDKQDLFVGKYGEYVNVSRKGQLEIKAVLDAYLKRIERSARGLPVRLYPFTTNRRDETMPPVAIDPRVQFGRPCITGTGIPTAILAERYKAGDTISQLAEDYHRPPPEIEEALRYEFKVEAA